MDVQTFVRLRQQRKSRQRERSALRLAKAVCQLADDYFHGGRRLEAIEVANLNRAIRRERFGEEE